MRTKKAILEDVESYGPEYVSWIEPEDADIKVLFAKGLLRSPVGQAMRSEGLATDENLDLIIARSFRTYGPEFTFTQFMTVAASLKRLGKLIEPPAAEPEPEEERDSLGRVLSPKAKQWKRWREWCNDPVNPPSMREIQEKRRTDPAFAEFYAHEADEERIKEYDASAAAPVKKTSKKVTDDLLLFVKKYNATPADRLRNRGDGVVELVVGRDDKGKLITEPMLYTTFLDLQDRAARAQLIR